MMFASCSDSLLGCGQFLDRRTLVGYFAVLFGEHARRTEDDRAFHRRFENAGKRFCKQDCICCAVERFEGWKIQCIGALQISAKPLRTSALPPEPRDC